MRISKSLTLRAVAIAASAFCASANAGVIIDLFNDPVGSTQTVSTATLGATVNNQDGPFPTTNVIGGYRDLSIQKTGDIAGAANSGTSTLEAGGGSLLLSNDTGNYSRGFVTWDGSNNAGPGGSTVNTTGLGGVDLTFGGTATTFLATVQLADLGFNYRITVWDMDGSSATLQAGVQTQIVLGSPATAHYDFSWFNLANGSYCDGVPSPPSCANPATQLDFTITRGGNLGAIDFAHIGALQLELWTDSAVASSASADFGIGTIQTIPEPGTVALVGLGLLGGAFARRRAAKSA